MANGFMTGKTRRYTLIAALAALYFVLSAMLKIPVGGNIKLDLGYAVLMVAAIHMGALPAALAGGIGAALESMLMSQRGIAPGWILMNVIIGVLCGLVLYKRRNDETKQLVIASCVIVPASMIPAVAVKTLIDCVMYALPVAAKIPTALVALVADSVVMLGAGLPLAIALKGRVKW